MKYKLLHHTPLWVAAKAIRTAWQSQGKSDSTERLCCICCLRFETLEEFVKNNATKYICKECGNITPTPLREVILGEADKALIKRVGVKFKHASTLEHITVYFDISDPEILEFFNSNDFSTVTKNMVRTNLRVLVENKNTLSKLIAECLLSSELGYIFEEVNDDSN